MPDLAQDARTPDARPRRSSRGPSASGESNAVATSAIGPHGHLGGLEAPPASRRGPRRRTARRGSAAARRGARPGRRSWRTAGRRRAPASPSASHSRGHWRSDPTATASSPSAVANVSYGTMFGWALPRRPGGAPVTNAFCAWLTRTARVDASSETSTRWPGRPPRRARAAPARMPIDRVQAGHDVADGDADLGRLAAVGVGVTGDRHQPADRLDDEVVARAGRAAGPVRAVAADREVDEPRVEGPRARRRRTRAARAPPGRRFSTRTSAPARSRRRTSAPSGVLQVEADRALVAVDRQEVGRGPRAGRRVADPRRTPAARRVAVGRLDLDDVGAEVGQEHRRVGAGEDRREVDDPQPDSGPVRRSGRRAWRRW